MAKKYVQIPTAYLSGAGVIIGATSVTINSFTDIYGNALTMTDFGDTGYCTVEPDTTNEESFTFTSITANANGTVTLGGIKTSLAKSPYTETTGLLRAHVGGSKVVVSDTAAFWNTFANKNNDETVTGLWTFTQPPSGFAPGSVPDASQSAMGVLRTSTSTNLTIGTFTVTIASPGVFTLNNHGLTVNDRVQFTTTGALPTGLSTATTYYVISSGLTANNFQVSASLSGTAVNTSGSQSGTHTLIKTTPIAVVPTDWRLNGNFYAADTGAANAYVITITNPPTAYVAGQIFAFKATNASTTVSTLNVNGLGAKTIKKLNGATDIGSGDIAAGMVVFVEYDGTNMCMINAPATILTLTAGVYPAGDGSLLTNLPRQYVYDSTQAGASISIAGVASQNVFTRTIAANTLKAGSSIKIKFAVSWQSANFSVQNWKLELKFGGTVIATTQLSTAGTGANDFWNGYNNWDITINCTTTSTQTTFLDVTSWNLYQNNAGVNSFTNNVTPAGASSSTGAAAIDVTTSQNLTLDYTRVTSGNGGTLTVGNTLIEFAK